MSASAKSGPRYVKGVINTMKFIWEIKWWWGVRESRPCRVITNNIQARWYDLLLWTHKKWREARNGRGAHLFILSYHFLYRLFSLLLTADLKIDRIPMTTSQTRRNLELPYNVQHGRVLFIMPQPCTPAVLAVRRIDADRCGLKSVKYQRWSLFCFCHIPSPFFPFRFFSLELFPRLGIVDASKFVISWASCLGLTGVIDWCCVTKRFWGWRDNTRQRTYGQFQRNVDMGKTKLIY